MNTQAFIKTFNKGGQQQKSKLIIDNDLREPTQHLILALTENAPYEAFHILGFAKMRAGIWYAATRDGKRIPMTAFELHPSGAKTFSEWAVLVPINFAEAHKEMFIAAFDNLVLPKHADN